MSKRANFNWVTLVIMGLTVLTANAAVPMEFSKRGVNYFEGSISCPLRTVSSRGEKFCNRLALFDANSVAAVDSESHTILIKNTTTYKATSTVGEVLFLAEATIEDGSKIPLGLHLIISKSGDEFVTKHHSHYPMKIKVQSVSIEAFKVVVNNGKKDAVVLDKKDFQDILQKPRFINNFFHIADRGQKTADTIESVVSLGIKSFSKSLFKVTWTSPTLAKAKNATAFLTDTKWEVSLTALTRWIPKKDAKEDLFLYGLEDLASLDKIKENGLGKNESIIFKFEDGHGSVTYSGQTVDVPDVQEKLRAFLEFNSFGMAALYYFNKVASL